MELDPEAVELAHRIFDLAREGETSTLAGYLRSGISADLTDPAGNTLLMLAAYHGRPATVQLVIAAGADLNRVNDRGQTPLAGAVFKNYLEVVQLLTGAGADPQAVRSGHRGVLPAR
jgi:ankyrin repeat protein